MNGNYYSDQRPRRSVEWDSEHGRWISYGTKNSPDDYHHNQMSLFEYQEEQEALQAYRSGAKVKAAKWERLLNEWTRLHDAGWDSGDIADALYDLMTELSNTSDNHED